MKVPKRDFVAFKNEFLLWQGRFGLTQYEIYFKFETLKKNQGEIVITEMGKSVTVFLTNEIEKNNYEHFNPKDIGKHECIHLLLHRMKWLGEQRYIETNDLDEEWEALVRRIEKVL